MSLITNPAGSKARANITAMTSKAGHKLFASPLRQTKKAPTLTPPRITAAKA